LNPSIYDHYKWCARFIGLGLKNCGDVDLPVVTFTVLSDFRWILQGLANPSDVYQSIRAALQMCEASEVEENRFPSYVSNRGHQQLREELECLGFGILWNESAGLCHHAFLNPIVPELMPRVKQAKVLQDSPNSFIVECGPASAENLMVILTPLS